MIPRRKMLVKTTIGLFAGFLLSPAHVGVQAAMSVNQANKAITDAQSLQQAGRFQKSIAEVKKNLKKCSDNIEPKSCRLKFLYTIAYLHQKEAKRDPNNREAYLGISATHLRVILKESPHHSATIRKLVNVYKRLQKPELVEELLVAELEHPGGRAAQNYRMLGKVYENRGQWSEAQAIYRTGLGVNPESSSLRRNMVSTYRYVSLSNSEDIFYELRSWEAEYPRIVVRGYEQLLERATGLESRLASEVLIHWVALLGQKRTVSDDVLNKLPKNWNTPATQDLRHYVANAQHMPAPDSWWLSGNRRREALALLGSAIGKKQQVSRKKDAAEMIWRNASNFAPAYGQAKLKINTSLALYYLSNKDVDPKGRKLRSLVLKLHEDLNIIERIFNTKTRVNRMGSSEKYDEAKQRYHTVLGFIYFKQEKWGNAKQKDSAIYQLSRVLKVAAQRKSRSGSQPLASIKRQLAKSYAAVGDIPKSQEYYLLAAEAYIDRDRLSSAKRMLTKAKKQKVTDNTQLADLTASLVQMVDVRRNFNYRKKIDKEKLAGVDDSISIARFPALDPEFVRRQQFRVYADLGSNRYISEQLRSEHFSPKAWQFLNGENELLGTGDLLRVRRLIKNRPRNILISQEVERNAAQLINVSAKRSGVFISIPERRVRKFVQIPRELLVTGTLYDVLNRRRDSPDDKYTLEVKKGQINIRSKLSEKELRHVKEEVYQLKKNRSISIKELPSAPKIAIGE